MKFFIIFGIIKWIDMFVPRFVASNPLSAQTVLNNVSEDTCTCVFYSIGPDDMLIHLGLRANI